MRLRIAFVLGLACIGCSCGATSTTAPQPAPSSALPSPDYEVHEWGLVRAEPGDVLRIGAIAPPVDTTPMVVLKPLLYFHTSARATLASVTVRGSIVEAWPPVPVGAQATWANVTIDPGAACTPSPLPTSTDPFCTALGDFCETAGLAVARTDDAACVTTGGTTDRFLFYRGRSTTLTPPLRFESTGSAGEARVTNESDAPIPGTLVRIWASMGETRAVVVAPPAPHASIIVASPAAAPSLDMPVADPSPSLAAARAALRASMTEIGLTEPEADAFLRAWDATLFPVPGTTATITLGLPAPAESFVYFLPSTATDAVATLAFDPPPRTVHRAIAVWSMLARTGATH